MGRGHERGRTGEDVAAAFLHGEGWTILDRNWRAGHSEIDIVALHGGIVAFVEVKTRADTGAGDPLEAVTPRKRREVERAASAWLRARAEVLRGVHTLRFDAVAVNLVSRGPPAVRHLPDAWRAGER